MSRFAKVATQKTASQETCIRPSAARACLAGGILAALLCANAATATAQGTASVKAAPPDLSSGDTGWISVGGEWIANLTQFAKDSLKKSNDEVLRGKAMYSREARCWATGVPVYLLNPAQPTFFLQTPEKVVMIWQMDQQVRHVYLNVPHSENPKPSWYGESVGHYEDDTLVVDTIAQTTQTFVDNYRTPHSDRLHVVERYRLVDGGNALQADITIEDPAVFIEPLQVIHRWRRVQGQMIESRCAEGNFNYFNQEVEPLPTAEVPDF
jgi:hypothetical protein